VNEFWGLTIGEINDQATSLHHGHKQKACELEKIFLKIFCPHGKTIHSIFCVMWTKYSMTWTDMLLHGHILKMDEIYK
jgi:hypothetical protein